MMQCPMLTRYWKKKTADGVNRNRRNARVEETHQRVYLVLTHCTTIAQNALASKLNVLVIPIVDARVEKIPMDREQLSRPVFTSEKGTGTSLKIILSKAGRRLNLWGRLLKK